jgi:hypothetical protein
LKGREYINAKMAKNMKEVLRIFSNMVGGSSIFPIEIIMKVHMLKAFHTVRECIYGKMEHLTRVISLKELGMALAP